MDDEVVIAKDITDCDESASGDLVIPDEINGMPVTAIEGLSFAFCESINSVTIPDSVTSIGDWVFEFCSSLSNGIEHLSEIADLIKASCDLAVKEIGKSRKGKHKYRPYDIVFYSVVKKEIGKDRNHDYSCKREPVWYGIPIFEQIFKHFIFLQAR